MMLAMLFSARCVALLVVYPMQQSRTSVVHQSVERQSPEQAEESDVVGW
jgi:hypothetical protein